MFKGLINKLFGTKEVEQTANVYDFSADHRQPGHDISITIFGDGETARAVIWAEPPVNVGDIIVFQTDIEGVEYIYNFAVSKVEKAGEGIYQVELDRVESEG